MIKLKWVPVPIVQKALIEKRYREISFFLYLKMTNSGYVRLLGSKKKEIIRNFSISNSTVSRYLKILIKWGWLGYNRETQTYYIRGFKYILEKERYLSKTAVHFQPCDLFDFQTYSFSVQVALLLRSQFRKERRGGEQKTWCSNQSPALRFRPVSLSVMEQVVGLSKDTVVDIKKRSIEMGYLKRNQNFLPLYNVKNHSKEIYKIAPELYGLLRKVGSDICIQQPDSFVDHHIFKRKKWG